MGESIFITGASGFIGSHLLTKISQLQSHDIFCLSRDATKITPLVAKDPRVKIIQADLLDIDRYRDVLSSCSTVVHLAAAAGKTGSSKHSQEAILLGTKQLIDACERKKAKNFLFVSSIAAKYSDKSYYPYASGKKKAEEYLQASSLKYSIVRPTIVIGEDSPIWKGLAGVAKAPVIPLFETKPVMIQPIYIDDLIRFFLSILRMDLFDFQIREIGGPQRVTYKEFLGDIHKKIKNKEPKFFRLPYKPIKRALGMVEIIFPNLSLPITAGQLSAFGNDGTIEENSLYLDQAPSMITIPKMLDELVPVMLASEVAQALDRECEVFSRFLVGRSPDSYIIAKYHEAHQNSADLQYLPRDRFERLLLTLSVKSPLMSKIVDAFSSWFLKHSLLRKKIILITAILENSPSTYAEFDSPNSTSLIRLLIALGWQGISFAVIFVVSMILFLPLKVILSSKGNSSV